MLICKAEAIQQKQLKVTYMTLPLYLTPALAGPLTGISERFHISLPPLFNDSAAN